MSQLNFIKTRFSVRKFKDQQVEDNKIKEILECGRQAPSGLNNQPWTFIVIKNNEIKEKIASCTKYGTILSSANVLIAVFFKEDEGYNRTKDIQALGACIENMMLAIHVLGLGGVWIGEILNQRQNVEVILEVPKTFELQAVIALGYPADNLKKTSSRKELKTITYLNKYNEKINF
ncbi:MAG: nitroreductase family protein [Candidatus Lokiarchaeota archaeon]|nr:nitroreductase family protein [Candidatus Lokiarchaeota archaeon]